LLAVGAGAAATALWRRDGWARLAAIAAVAWHAHATSVAYPHVLAYANEAFGGVSGAWRSVGDSNADWGQGLPDLQRWLEAHPGGLILSYFGRDCPARLGLARQDAFSTPGPCPGSAPLPVGLEREWLAVSATKWQGFYESGRPAFAWLRERRPAAVLGGSLLVYDVSADAEAHETLAGMYRATGRPAEAARETARAAYLRRGQKEGARLEGRAPASGRRTRP